MIRTKGRMRLCISLLLCNLAFIWGNSMLTREMSGAISQFVASVTLVSMAKTEREEETEEEQEEQE